MYIFVHCPDFRVQKQGPIFFGSVKKLMREWHVISSVNRLRQAYLARGLTDTLYIERVKEKSMILLRGVHSILEIDPHLKSHVRGMYLNSKYIVFCFHLLKFCFHLLKSCKTPNKIIRYKLIRNYNLIILIRQHTIS